MIRTGLIVSAIAVTLMAGINLWLGAKLPADNIPVHWGIDGQPDRFGDRAEALAALWIIPAAAALTAIVLCIIPSIAPRRENLRKSRKAYVWTWTATMLLLVSVHAGIAFMKWRWLSDSEGVDANEFVRLVIAGTGILFITLGNVLPKTRQNFFLGVRTPWTLSSEYAWEKTHRLAGRLFMASGFICLIGAFVVDGIWLVSMLMACVLPSALISVVYSYFAWRSAPDKAVGPDYIV